MTDDLVERSDYDLADLISKPFRSVSGAPRIQGSIQAERERERAWNAMRGRGYTNGQLHLIEEGDYTPIDRRLNY